MCWLRSLFVVFGNFVQGWHWPFYCVWLRMAHIFYFLCVVLLEYHLSELSWAYVFVRCRFVHVFLRCCEFVHQRCHSLCVLTTWVTLFWLSFHGYLDLSFQLHVSLYLCVDGEIAERKYFFFIPCKSSYRNSYLFQLLRNSWGYCI